MYPRKVERAAPATALVMAAALGCAARASPPPEPVPFVARYSVSWHGITAGTSTLELTRAATDHEFLYASTDDANGLFGLIFPHPLQQASRFRIVDGQVVPLSFRSAGAGQDAMVQFDWKINRVTGSAKGKLVNRPLHAGTQDPLSVQIALMLALEAGRVPADFWMLDTDDVERFDYVRHGEKTLDTPLGKLRTVLYTSHQPGSSRTTYLWLAPALDYMPARAEQHIKGTTELAFEIEAFRRK